MPQPRRRAGFTQETKPHRFISKISLADDFKCHGAAQMDVERLVSDPHRTATQLDRSTVFARHQLVMLKSLQDLFGCCPLHRILESRRLARRNRATKGLVK